MLKNVQKNPHRAQYPEGITTSLTVVRVRKLSLGLLSLLDFESLENSGLHVLDVLDLSSKSLLRGLDLCLNVRLVGLDPIVLHSHDLPEVLFDAHDEALPLTRVLCKVAVLRNNGHAVEWLENSEGVQDQ